MPSGDARLLAVIRCHMVRNDGKAADRVGAGATTALLEANPGSRLGTISHSGLQWLATPAGNGPVIINVSIQSGP
jgi:hypothetical protein